MNRRVLAVSVLALILLAACDRPERPIASAIEPADGGSTQSFSGVATQRSTALLFELRGADFGDARGKGCPLEAVVEEPKAGESPILGFRCAIYGGP